MNQCVKCYANSVWFKYDNPAAKSCPTCGSAGAPESRLKPWTVYKASELADRAGPEKANAPADETGAFSQGRGNASRPARSLADSNANSKSKERVRHESSSGPQGTVDGPGQPEVDVEPLGEHSGDYVGGEPGSLSISAGEVSADPPMCADGKEAFAVVVGTIILDPYISHRAFRLFNWLYLRASKAKGAKNRGTAPVNISRIAREMGGRRGDWSAAYGELVSMGYVIPQGERRNGASHRTLIPSLLTRWHDPFYELEEVVNG